jgi:tetratricopeptide (TPR) repeat protein
MYLAQEGRMTEALAELKLASELDPLSFIIVDNYGWLLYLAGRHREALRMLDRALALNPGFDQTKRIKALTLAALGRVSEAAELARETKSLDREMDIYMLGVLGLRAEAETLRAGLEARTITNRFRALLAAGRQEEALAALDDPSGVGYGDCIELSYHPFFDPVRDDPRFIRYLAALGQTEADARAQAWRAAHPPEKPEAKK